MPIGYPATVGFITLITLLALAPRRSPRALGKISWLSSLLVNEVPFVAFGALVVATALTIDAGEISSAGGWVIVGVAVAAMIGLVVIARRGLRAAPALDDALTDALGPGWRTTIDPALTASLRRRRPLARSLACPWPWLTRPGAVERVANISYGPAGRYNHLDLYRHRSRPADAPVLVYMHGGGYASGAKSREALPLLHRLASQGWVCISANYRLRPAATFPDHLVDLKKVIAWAREHGAEYGMDRTALFVAGSSSGAHLASLAALTPDDPAFQPGFEHADTSVSAAICLYGYLGGYNGGDVLSSPAGHVRRDAPPFFLAQGELDTYSPNFVQVTRGFVAKLRGSSDQPVVYAELPGGQHSFDLYHSLRFESVVDAIEAFAAWVRSGQQACRAPLDESGPRGPAPRGGDQRAARRLYRRRAQR